MFVKQTSTLPYPLQRRLQQPSYGRDRGVLQQADEGNVGWVHSEVTLCLDEKGKSALCGHMEAIGEPSPKSGTEKTDAI